MTIDVAGNSTVLLRFRLRAAGVIFITLGVYWKMQGLRCPKTFRARIAAKDLWPASSTISDDAIFMAKSTSRHMPPYALKLRR